MAVKITAVRPFPGAVCKQASLLVVSIGMTWVIITKGINLSVAGMIALTSTATASMLTNGAS